MDVKFRSKISDAKEIARKILSLQSYAFQVAVDYSFSGAEKRQELLTANGQYELLKNETIEHWKANGKYELNCIANKFI